MSTQVVEKPKGQQTEEPLLENSEENIEQVTRPQANKDSQRNSSQRSNSQENNPKKKLHSFHLQYLKDLIAAEKLPVETAKKLLDYWKTRLTNAEDPVYQNYFDYYLFFEAANAGILSAWVIRMSDYYVLHNYGIFKESFPKLMELVKKTKAEQNANNTEIKQTQKFTVEEQTFQLWLRSYKFHNEEYMLIVLHPTHLIIEKQLARFANTFKHFYMPESFHKDKRFFSIFSNQSQVIAEQCNHYLRQKKMVTFTHLQFESYKKDLVYIGESYSHLLLQELRSFLSEKLNMKDDDILLTIDAQRFLIISFDQNYENIKKAFRRLVIRAKSIVFPYSIKVSTYNEPIESLASVWSQITQR